jgi:serine/threonine protein kinase
MTFDPQRVQELFAEACELSDDDQVSAMLARECADQPALRREVESLLRASRSAGVFLSQPETTNAEALNRLLDFENMRIGNYRLISLIGEGGFGSVFLAEQEQPIRRKVALKIIKLGMDTAQVVARFQLEQQALALMEHPLIAKVFDAGIAPHGRPYFVMEWIPGAAITRYCDTNCLSIAERLQILEQVCLAIQHAHEKGVLHRDIKPSNVLVTEVDGKPSPRIIDFGIAKALTGNLAEQAFVTQTQQLVGTPHYISPEQAQMLGGEIDARSDIYSLGVLLYELLAGATPFDLREFEQASPSRVQQLICDTEPPALSARARSNPQLATIAAQRKTEPGRLPRQLQGELDWVVLKCLEKSPARRYESAGALAADLRRYQLDQPVLARPASLGRRLARGVRRHRVALTFGIIGCAALAIGVIAGMAARHDPKPQPAVAIPPVVAVTPAKKIKTTDLLPLLDVESGNVLGRWEKQETTLLASGGETANRLQIPYQPTGEYDFEIEFTVESGDGPVIQICPTSTRNLLWQVAWDGYGFEGGGGLPGGKRALLKKNVLYRGVVKVRHATISGSLDGVQIAAFERQQQEFGLANSPWSLPDEKQLGLGIWNSKVRFSKIVIHELQD